MKKRQRGLTLIELMVTLAVAIVILAIGIPAFNAMSARDMSAATVNALVAALQQARVEAIGRGVAGGVSVVSSDWNSAWTVQLARDGTLIRNFVAPRSSQISITGGTSPVTFGAEGLLVAPASPVTFTVLAYKDAGKAQASCVRATKVVVAVSGQVRLEDATCP